MGGNLGSKLMRPFRNWNIDSRAQKIISKEKPTPAPTYESTKQQIRLVDKWDPDYKKVAQTKDSQFNDYLKKVYVTSNSAEVQEIDSRSDPKRPLPTERLNFEGFEFGFYEPQEVKLGRVTLRQALTFINKHNENPEIYTVDMIAKEYNLDSKVVEKIIEYFKIFRVIDQDKDSHIKDVVATSLKLSMQSGITVPHTEKKKKSILKDFLSPPSEEEEEEKSKLSEREKVKKIQDK